MVTAQRALAMASGSAEIDPAGHFALVVEEHPGAKHDTNADRGFRVVH
jgi:hypothetical protein